MTRESEVARTETRTVARLGALYRSYGYAQYKMSKFEEYELYVRNKDFLVSNQIITFTDNGRLMALKPDVTLSIIRNGEEAQKVYYNEHVYRVPKGGAGFREMLQVGLECMGEIDAFRTYEVLMLAAESLAVLAEDFVLDISHMGVVCAALDAAALSPAGRAAVLRAVADKSLQTVAAVCASEGVCAETAALLRALVTDCGAPADVLPRWRAALPEGEARRAVDELAATALALVERYGARIRIDFSVLNDMGYYNGIVFKGFVNGVPASVLSGGRYDTLMRKMGKRAGAIGFAVYMDELARLTDVPPVYDVDTVLLYDETADLAALRAAVEALVAEGVSVSAERAVPEKRTYRRLMRLVGEGVETIEDRA
ncbi:MAG: ATP phosphoribosyltransferase regulatory subunit [Clostridia bacterium]|nr:ATP phosphoribosyltransferase regulatory subunit [Clostridia bacterium]